mmetsp:Transcript_29405/g.52582  ORF Transcript_29405/g.52582 Transcript_29405/m.52582 type:complete len:551 (-) Transcript_29405:1532-3184(-)
MAPTAVFPTVAEGGHFQGRLAELLTDVDDLSPRVTALAHVAVRYRDSLQEAQSCGAAVCSAMRDLFAGELGERMATGSPLSLVRLLAALTEMADFLGELSQQVDAHLCEGVQRRWAQGLLPGVQTHRLCLNEARAYCEDLAASKGAEGGGERGGKRHDEGYAERAVERASASLASEVGQVSVLMRHEFMEVATAYFHSHLRFFTQGQKMAADVMGLLPPMMAAIDEQKSEGREALVQLDRQLVAQRGFDAMDMRQPAGSLTASQVEQEMQEGWAALLSQCYSLSNNDGTGFEGGSSSGAVTIDSAAIERIVSGADAMLAQLPGLLGQLQGSKVVDGGAEPEERVRMHFHRQAQLMLDCLAADAAHSLCKSDIKKVLAWTYGYRQLLQDLGGASALLAYELLHTTASSRNEGKAPGELLIAAYLTKLREEHRGYIANVIRADYCGDESAGSSSGEAFGKMDAHKMARGARDLFHILQARTSFFRQSHRHDYLHDLYYLRQTAMIRVLYVASDIHYRSHHHPNLVERTGTQSLGACSFVGVLLLQYCTVTKC